MADMKKCAHPQCKCSVISNGPFGQYCSEHCKESAAQTEIMCDCKHPACRWRAWTWRRLDRTTRR